MKKLIKKTHESFFRKYYTHCHALVDGAWGHWLSWSDCSVSCGGGRRNKSRNCDNPLPDAGGLLCPSTDGSWLSITSNGTLKHTDTQICNLADCPTTLTTTTTPPDKGIISNHNFVQLL